MPEQPLVIAFDVLETLLRLEPLRDRIVAAGQPPHLLELWFARLLRDAFALSASGGYQPFASVAAAALGSASKHELSAAATRHIVAGFAELEPHPDVEPAMRLASDAGVRMVTLTNGSAENTLAALRSANLHGYLERALSVDDIQRYKPAPEIYHYAAETCQVPADRLALVAAHSWDIHGAHRAGLVTGWVSRLEGRYPDTFDPPDVTGDDLLTVVSRLLAPQDRG